MNVLNIMDLKYATYKYVINDASTVNKSVDRKKLVIKMFFF